MTPGKPEKSQPVRLFTKQWLVVWFLVAIIGFFILPGACRAWQINAWSIQYSHQVLNPQADQAAIPDPPGGHGRADLWLAISALQRDEPDLAEHLIAAKAAGGDPLAMNLLIDALLAQGKFAGAVVIAQQTGQADLLRTIGYQAQTAGSLEAALQAFEAAWKLDAESGTLPLANLLINSKQDYASAEILLRNAQSTYPHSKYWPGWSNRLGDMLRTQKRWPEAEAAYQATLVVAPDDWAAHIGLGWVFYERGDGLQAALAEFQLALGNPESKGLGQYAIGQVLMREKRYEEAGAWFEQALALNPQNRWFYILRGNAAREAGNLELAQAVYQQSISLFPDFAYAYYEMAYAFQLSDQPAAAVAAIEQALKLISPANIWYFLRAGSIFEGGGETGRALEAYRQALQLDPHNASALAGLERLSP